MPVDRNQTGNCLIAGSAMLHCIHSALNPTILSKGEDDKNETGLFEMLIVYVNSSLFNIYI